MDIVVISDKNNEVRRQNVIKEFNLKLQYEIEHSVNP